MQALARLEWRGNASRTARFALALACALIALRASCVQAQGLGVDSSARLGVDSEPEADVSATTTAPAAPAAAPVANAPAAPAAAPPAAPATAAAAPATAPATVEPAPPPTDAPPSESETLVERQQRAQNTWLGPVGGVHVLDAGSGAAGSLRFQLGLDFFSTSNFMATGDHNDYSGGSLAVSWTVLDELEIYGSLENHANWNDHETPALLQELGDSLLGFKGFYPVMPWLTLGGDLRFALLNGVGSIGPSLSALSFGIRANASADLRGLTEPVPLIARLSLDYFFDNSSALIEDVENARYAALGPDRLLRRDEDRHLVRRVERFALGINRTDFIDIAAGVEVPLRAAENFFIHPLAEWTLGIPVNRQGYNCLLVATTAGLDGEDGCLDAQGLAAMPSTLTFGARVFPPVRGLSFLLAFDIGLSGASTFVRELAPNKPYDVMLAVSYATDTRAPAAAPAPPPAPPPPLPPAPPKSRVQGVVTDVSTSAVLEHAIIAYPERDLTAQATDVHGQFLSYELDPGEVRFEISHPDYETKLCTAQIPQPLPPPIAEASTHGTTPTAVESHEPALNPYVHGAPAPATPPAPAAAPLVSLRCELTPKPRLGAVHGLVDGPDGAPIVAARVELSGPAPQSLQTDAQGRFELPSLLAGSYTARVDADGFMIRLQSFDVATGQTATPQITLVPKPKQSHVELTKQEVRIRKQIFFNLNSAEISAKSHELVNEIADVLLRNPQVRQVEIQGHTDSTGNPEVNRQLSQLRAEAVRSYLISAGVDAARLAAKGYGDERPLLPNLTERNRAQNRRVQFIIRAQD